tara:strand:- start:918 stop:1148 length:231 start_codon:yes stop_codon:yes gene_type:complete
MEDQEIIAKSLAKDIKLMISKEIDAKLDDFLEREEEELTALFSNIKKEEAEWRLNLLEGLKTHTARIKKLEGICQY